MLDELSIDSKIFTGIDESTPAPGGGSLAWPDNPPMRENASSAERNQFISSNYLPETRFPVHVLLTVRV
jgi:hypothetical protein